MAGATDTNQAGRIKSVDNAITQIQRQFGKGAIMRLGSEERENIPVIPTYHPAYILRQSTKENTSKAKWDTWNDMQKALEIVRKSR